MCIENMRSQVLCDTMGMRSTFEGRHCNDCDAEEVVWRALVCLSCGYVLASSYTLLTPSWDLVEPATRGTENRRSYCFDLRPTNILILILATAVRTYDPAHWVSRRMRPGAAKVLEAEKSLTGSFLGLPVWYLFASSCTALWLGIPSNQADRNLSAG
jgi:ribosomal protein S27E